MSLAVQKSLGDSMKQKLTRRLHSTSRKEKALSNHFQLCNMSATNSYTIVIPEML